MKKLQQSELILQRVSGAGNTFFILDLTKESHCNIWSHLSFDDKIRKIQKICNNPIAERTDGFIALSIIPYEHDSRHHLSWEFYNADGSMAEMCGNAARCVAKFALEKIDSTTTLFYLKTNAGQVVLKVLSKDQFSVEMPKLSSQRQVDVQLPNMTTIRGLSVDTGVPHFVTEAKLSATECAYIRNRQDIFPKGTNVTLVSSVDGLRIKAVTYERGVEHFTAACGTGAVAAAVWLRNTRAVNSEVIVIMPGGELKVSISEKNNIPILIGPAVIQHDMSVVLEDL